MNSGDFVLIVTTCDQRAPLEAMARELVERNLAACVQLGGPVSSTYRWQGQIEQANEWQLAAKATLERREEVFRLIKSLHPYEVPELIAMPFAAGSADYAAWLKS